MNRLVFVGVLGLLLAIWCQGACAQWVWKDDAGHTVFSDQPPPPGVSKAHIVRTPSGPSTASASTDSAPAADNGDGTSPNHPKTLAEQNLEFNKRQKESAENAKKAAADQAAADQKAQRCVDARNSLNTLQSGQRVATIDAQGNRNYMDDTQRQVETTRAQTALQGC